MVFQYKVPNLYPVSAQTAGEELTRIYQEQGKLEPEQIVAESRSVASPLHPVFEWDDEVAAEKYRCVQAAGLIRAIVTVEELNGKPQEIRAFVHVQQSFHPLSVVVTDQDAVAELLEDAKKEAAAFRRKYETLEALRQVIEAIDDLLEEDKDSNTDEEEES